MELAPQPDHLAAVDHDGRARHEPAGIGGEQQQRAVEIALLAQAANRNLSRDLRALGGEELAVDLALEGRPANAPSRPSRPSLRSGA
jgi:hypothetical protein